MKSTALLAMYKKWCLSSTMLILSNFLFYWYRRIHFTSTDCFISFQLIQQFPTSTKCNIRSLSCVTLSPNWFIPSSQSSNPSFMSFNANLTKSRRRCEYIRKPSVTIGRFSKLILPILVIGILKTPVSERKYWKIRLFYWRCIQGGNKWLLSIQNTHEMHS